MFPTAPRIIAALVIVAAASLVASWARAGTPSPADWRDVSIYQIMTDRFFNGDPSNDAVEGHFDPADGARNHGGDWAGIEQKLDYIAALGATAIWISPVQTNAYAAYHGYHIRDFYSFSEHFGGLAALTSLVDAAHARGIYVILDVIANHGGDLVDSGDASYPAFQNPGTYTLRWRDPPNYPAPPFDNLSKYHNNGGVWNWTDPEQILGEIFGLDDFRTEDPTVRADLIAAHRWLIEQTDADGFRIDTVKHVELDFWQDFAPQIRSFAADSLGKADFFLFGEIFDGSAAKNGIYTGTRAGGPFALDAVLWYPMYFASREVFRDGLPTEWLSFVLADSTEYDPWAVGRNVNFLDNHDNGRFMGYLSGADGDDAKLRTALTWQHTSLGIPLVYYGTEQEFDGGGDPHNREDMWDGQWDFGPSRGDNFDMTTPIFRHVRRLNELRAATPALRRGTQEDVASSPGAGLYAYYRRLAGESTALVVINTDTRSQTLTLDPDFPAGTIEDGVSGRVVNVPATGSIALEAGGLTAAVFVETAPAPAPWVVATWPPHDRWLRSGSGELRIAFTEPMDHASVASAVSITPDAPTTSFWVGNTLALRPSSALAAGTRYRVTVGGAAASAAGTPLGAEFSFEFEVASPLGGFTIATGYSVALNPGTDAFDPISLARGPDGTAEAGRLLLGDNGTLRVFDAMASGFVEARVADEAIARPSALAVDVSSGVFGGDVLLTQSSVLTRLHRAGAAAGLVSTLAALPASASDWIVAVDGAGTLGGEAFVGRAGDETLWRVNAAGERTAEMTGFGGVRGLTSSDGGPFGPGLYVLDGDGSVSRVGAGGTLTTVASNLLLVSARGLTIDPTGAFGSAMYTARPTTGSILRIDPNGAVSTFASGFAGFPPGNCLAFDRLGNLVVIESGGSIRRLVTIVADESDSVVTVTPLPPTGAGITLVGPNPFRTSTRIDFFVPDDGVGAVPSRLTVHDVSGRRVATLLEGAVPPGPGHAVWDGRNDAGHATTSGVYFARLRVGPRESTAKLVRRP